MKHTPGTWKLGRNSDTVITDHPVNFFPEETEKHYGGHPIAESISTDADRHLISAAPDLLEACKKAYEALEAITEFCGQNLEVHGWHLNGDPEAFDNFINENMDGDELELLFKAMSKARGESHQKR
jgi:hypothetical protein